MWCLLTLRASLESREPERFFKFPGHRRWPYTKASSKQGVAPGTRKRVLGKNSHGGLTCSSCGLFNRCLHLPAAVRFGLRNYGFHRFTGPCLETCEGYIELLLARSGAVLLQQSDSDVEKCLDRAAHSFHTRVNTGAAWPLHAAYENP